MAQKILIVLTALAALVLNIAQANSAQLSTNPWLEANDDEAVAEVYRKEPAAEEPAVAELSGGGDGDD